MSHGCTDLQEFIFSQNLLQFAMALFYMKLFALSYDLNFPGLH
jgi:hypothetical protein